MIDCSSFVSKSVKWWYVCLFLSLLVYVRFHSSRTFTCFFITSFAEIFWIDVNHAFCTVNQTYDMWQGTYYNHHWGLSQFIDLTGVRCHHYVTLCNLLLYKILFSFFWWCFFSLLIIWLPCAISIHLLFLTCVGYYHNHASYVACQSC